MRLLIAMLTLSLALPAAAQTARFAFDRAAQGHVMVAADTPYDAMRGYGWEDAQRFSVKLPEGNYRVTLVLGGKQPSETTVKAEARRLMLEAVRTPAGRTVTRSFVVNIRTPQLTPPPENAPGGTAVRLPDGEAATATWDDRLTLEFLGASQHVSRVAIEPADVPTLYLVGDSTVTDQRAEPAASWGQMLPRFLDDRVAVANHAKSGETLKSFLTGLRLDKALSHMRKGDVLLIQFGHNDQKAQWPQTYADPANTFPAYLRAYVAEARRRGATPVLVTSPERRNFDDAGRIKPSHGDYPEAVRRVAREDDVALIDLTPMTIAFYEALGPGRAPLAFNDGGKDKTHHNNYGAYELARMVASRLGAAAPDIAQHVVPEARSYDPARPLPPEQFALPASGLHSDRRPEGN
ncbi:rhamnogalacturonan acetylesterase [Sphingomonas sp. BT-65]|uniref:rhamnogalacturonan acetylesterase n=1 Tax=Sphingomonas sp. BT-65 TaxID=2989821 RepID=UPI0022355A81|nr:rhamnogalacturonan acetylesterase [Sphingomonas sp. BT-65]MCW4462916.1 rhamnogalacturonan acetylesterase [Sphingomonas sp. BT-65]